MLKLLLSHPSSGTSSELVAVTTEMLASTGSRATLSYVYAKKSMGSHYIFWYKQLPGQAPHFLSYSGNGKPLNGSTRMSVSMTSDRERVLLHIEDVSLQHSAVYDCAVTPTGAYTPHSQNKKRLRRQGPREHREYTNEISEVQ
uniref:Ig-like domain-containing protein n=1 Tax=Hippocampus comes TaxID=109280 RepID=A0A3Q3DPN2_HIPCM